MNKTVCILLTAVFPSVLMSTTRHVYEPEGAQGIQNAIDISSGFDTVLVHSGTYYVRDVSILGITMRDSVILMSPSYDSVTLSGSNSLGTDTANHVIYCSFNHPSSYSEAEIKGFTILDGQAAYDRGGGIHCYQSNPVIQNNKIIHNSGWGIGLYYSSAIIDSNTINHNLGSGGVFLQGYPNEPPVINNNLISDNSGAHAGGGIFCNHASFFITNNTITDNYAWNYGGGITIFCCSTSSSNLVVKNNIISGNLSDLGGGVSCWYSGGLVENNIVSDNSGRYGGGFYLQHRVPHIVKNIIVNNLATERGGAIYSSGGSPVVKLSLIAGNTAETEGGVLHTGWCAFTVDSCFIIDNGSVNSNKSGLGYIAMSDSSDTVIIHNSNLYYNTFQPDIEIDNDAVTIIPCEYNYWWYIDSLAIDTLIEGPKNFSPWEVDFIPGVPGEPISVDSIRNYDNQYSIVIDSLEGDPDTLFLKICGIDRSTQFREAAVAIIKSSVYAHGVAVMLVESDTNSGIYRGHAVVKTSTGNDTIRTDDIRQTIRVNADGDTIRVIANMDTTKEFSVYYRCAPGIAENEKGYPHTAYLEILLNPFRDWTKIRWRIPGDIKPQMHIYDVSGRLAKTIPLCTLNNGEPTVISWDGRDNSGKQLASGVYFIKLQAGNYSATEKLLLIR